MILFRFMVGCFVAIMVIGCTASSARSQPLEKEVYSLDVFYVKEWGNSPEARARYWYDIALHLVKKSEASPELIELLRPIIQMRSNLSSLSGKDRQVAYAEFHKAFSSPELGDQIFEIVGAEKMTTVVLEIVKQNFAVEFEQNSRNATTPQNFLSGASMKALLKLSDEQERKLKSLVEEASLRIKTGSEVDFERLRALSDKRWREILVVLNDNQRAKVLSLIGTPVEWFRLTRESELFTQYVEAQPMTGRSLSEYTVNNRDLLKMSRDELLAINLQFFQPVTIQMVFDRFVWDELELSIEQRNDLSGSVGKEIRTVAATVPMGFRDYLKKLLAQEALLPKSLQDFFTSEQAKWFQQMELQILLGTKYGASAGVLSPTMISHLDLSVEQVSAVEKIAELFEQQSESLIQKINEARDEIRGKLELDTKAVLTKSQLDNYQKILGEGH